VAIVDPELTADCPWGVTLASGLDALTQLIEPYVSSRANPFTDAIALPAIPRAIAALRRLERHEDPSARAGMAWASLSGGIALANAGLGAVHGLAGVIGGLTGSAHGAICGALLGPVLEANRAALPAGSAPAARVAQVCDLIADALGCSAAEAPAALARWARAAGLPGLAAQGLGAAQHAAVASGALGASSMKANPVVLAPATLEAILEAAA
jgi:alcohol dehydrogenase class IV